MMRFLEKMEDIFIKHTKKTPQIKFIYNQGVIDIKGRSIIENTKKFFDPLFEWIKEYLKNPQPKTTINLAMDYYNTSTQMWLFYIIKELSKLQENSNNTVEINWFYQEEDLKEAGSDLKSFVSIPVNLIESQNLYDFD